MIRAPKVSVIVPAFNEPVEILEESLTSLMNQTFGDFECLVVDESTQPDLAQACERICARDARFRYLHPPHRLGLAASLNLGISLAQGGLIARFDSDDICLSNRLDVQVRFLEENSDISIVGSWMHIIGESNNVIGVRKYAASHTQIEKNFIYSNGMGHPSVMLRSTIIKDIKGPYSEEFKFSEDLELWLNLLARGHRFANIPDCLIQYRQNSTYRTRSNWRFNIKARLLHLKSPYLTLKIIAISALAIWTYLPEVFRKIIYKRALLN
jgi:glycosyltransferase involved in cell wall biosynthesis